MIFVPYRLVLQRGQLGEVCDPFVAHVRPLEVQACELGQALEVHHPALVILVSRRFSSTTLPSLATSANPSSVRSRPRNWNWMSHWFSCPAMAEPVRRFLDRINGYLIVRMAKRMAKRQHGTDEQEAKHVLGLVQVGGTSPSPVLVPPSESMRG